MLIGSQYRYLNPDKHSDYECITLDAFADNSSSFCDRISLLGKLKRQGKKIHGHNVIDNRGSLRGADMQTLLNHASLKMASVEGVDSWDVLNEVIGFLSHLDDSWPLKVLEKARELQPDSLLFLNEYALKNKEYWEKVVKLAAIAKRHGLLDGVGIQRHIDLRGKLIYSNVTKPFYATECFFKSWVNTKRLAYEVGRIQDLGLLCHISEVSIKCHPWQERNAHDFLDRLTKDCKKLNVWKFTYWGEPIKTCN